jgi:hypothetical protein
MIPHDFWHPSPSEQGMGLYVFFRLWILPLVLVLGAYISLRLWRRRERRIKEMSRRMGPTPRPAGPFRCPFCKLYLPPTTDVCDCGFEFHWKDSTK